MRPEVRPAGEADLGRIGPALRDALFGASPPARAWVAHTGSGYAGHLVATTLYATWTATRTLDVQRLDTTRPGDAETAAALLAAASAYAAGAGLSGVRVLSPPVDPRLVPPAGDVRPKIVFTLPGSP